MWGCCSFVLCHSTIDFEAALTGERWVGGASAKRQAGRRYLRSKHIVRPGSQSAGCLNVLIDGEEMWNLKKSQCRAAPADEIIGGNRRKRLGFSLPLTGCKLLVIHMLSISHLS